MPAKSRWLLQIPAMLETLRGWNSPVVDRAACERIFGVGRRRAIDLMQRFGGYQAGNAVLLDRAALIRRLEEMGASHEVEVEQGRKRRLSESLNEVRRYRAAAQIPIPVAPDVHKRRVGDLPAGVRLEVGMLSVRFDGAVQLLSSLYELSQAAVNDFESFRAAAEGPGDGK